MARGGGAPLETPFLSFILPVNLVWLSGNSGKAAVFLLDDAGNPADFIIAEGAPGSISHTDISVPMPIPDPGQWSGPAATGQSNPQPSYQRNGTTDNNVAADWQFGSQNIGNLNDDLIFPTLSPRVISISLDDPDPTPATSPVHYTVVFSVPVTGIETGATGPFDDFELTVTAGSLAGYLVTGVTELDPQTYRVAVSAGTGEGMLRLDVLASGGILDAELQPMIEDYTDGPAYTVDTLPPWVTGLTAVPGPAGIGALLVLNILFNEPMDTVVTTEVVVETGGNGTITASSVADLGDGVWISPTEYQVTLDRAIVAADNGTATVTVSSAQDSLGHVMNPDSTYTFEIDGTVPLITVDTLLTEDTTPPLTGTVADNDPAAEITVIVNGQNLSATNNGDGTWRLADDLLAPLPEGVYDVQVFATDSAGNVGTDTTTDELTIDPNALLIPPYVVTIVLNDPNPTEGPSVSFSVTFNEDVTGIETGAGPSDDFTLTETGSLTGAGIADIAQNDPRVYTVTINTGGGEGTLRLDVLRGGGILDLQGDPMDADHTSGPSYTVDTVSPTVDTLVALPDPAIIGGFVVFTIQFSEAMDTGVAPTVGLETVGNGGIAASSAALGGDGAWNPLDPTEYQVSLDRSLVPADAGLATITVSGAQDVIGHVMAPDSSRSLLIAEASTVFPPEVISITRNNPNPTMGPAAGFTVSFSEDVFGITTGSIPPFDDFALTLTSGSLTGYQVISVSQLAPESYSVTINTGIGEGTLRLDVIADGFVDAQDDPMAEDYTSGPEYTVDTIRPEVAAFSATPDPAGIGTSVLLTLSFSEPMDTAVSPTVIAQTVGNGSIYASSVTDFGDGMWNPLDPTEYLVSLDRNIVAADHGTAIVAISEAEDLHGLVMAPDSGYTFVIDGIVPSVTVDPRTTADQTPSLSGTVVDNDPDVDVLISVDGQNLSATTHGDGTWTLADNLLTPLAPGTYDVVARATDSAGNVGVDTTIDELTIDLSYLAVDRIQRLDPSPTNMPLVRFRVSFSSKVNGVETGATGPFDDFALQIPSGAITGAAITGVTASGETEYIVTAAIGSGDGELRLDVLSTGGIESIHGAPLPEDYTSGPSYTIAHLRFSLLLPDTITSRVDETVRLEVAVVGGTPPYNYQWYFAPPAKFLLPVGENSPVLVLSLLALDDAGEYFCEVTGSYESIACDPTTLVVEAPIPVGHVAGQAIMAAVMALASWRLLRRRR